MCKRTDVLCKSYLMRRGSRRREIDNVSREIVIFQDYKYMYFLAYKILQINSCCIGLLYTFPSIRFLSVSLINGYYGWLVFIHLWTKIQLLFR